MKETAKEKYIFEMQQDERAKARLEAKAKKRNQWRLEGLKCPYCESPDLREKMHVLVCNDCNKCFARHDAHSDEEPDHITYAKENRE